MLNLLLIKGLTKPNIKIYTKYIQNKNCGK